jgi:hypothetical protein
VDTDLPRPRWRFTGNYRLARWLSAGVEVNPRADEVGPLVTLFALTETETRPAVFFGTSSDRIGSPKGMQSYYMTGSKYLPQLRLAPYATINYSEWDDTINFPFGATAELGHGLSVRPMYDGHRTHLLGSWFTGRWGVTFIWAWLEKPGVAVSAGF